MRVDWSQQVVIDTSGGSAAYGVIPEDTNPAFNGGMYSGRSFWLMFVSCIAHNITMNPPIPSTTVVPAGGNTAVATGSRTAATTAMAQVEVTNNIPIPQEIPVGTTISAITKGGASTTLAKVSFVRCYP